MTTIAITGGTGLVGKALTQLLLNEGYEVTIFTRNPSAQPPISGVKYAAWNVDRQTIDIPALQEADHLIHLAGAGVVAQPWTAAYRKEIVDSRTKSSELLLNTLRQHPHQLKTFVSTSAIGWYGADHSPAVPFVETAPADGGFLGETCRLWEESVAGATELGIRLVILRTGIVLSNDGGALAEFKKPLRLGVAGILGGGRQMVSWIHIKDHIRLYLEAIENPNWNGIYNAVAPNPVSSKALTLELARQLNGALFVALPVPTFVLNLMLGDRSIEVLKSTTVSAKKLLEAGFQFQFGKIDAALHDLCKK